MDPALSFVLRKKIKANSQISTFLAKYDLILSHRKFLYHMSKAQSLLIFEPRREKTSLRGFRPGATRIGLYSHRSRLDA